MLLYLNCLQNILLEKPITNYLSERKSFCGELYVKKPEVATAGVLLKMVFLKILQNWQENTCAKAEACNFIKSGAGVVL